MKRVRQKETVKFKTDQQNVLKDGLHKINVMRNTYFYYSMIL